MALPSALVAGALLPTVLLAAAAVAEAAPPPVTLTLEVASGRGDAALVAATTEVIERRIDAYGAAARIRPLGGARLEVDVRGGEVATMKRLVATPARFAIHRVEAVAERTPEPTPGRLALPAGANVNAGLVFVVDEAPVLTGDAIADAKPTPADYGPGNGVAFRLDRAGAQAFCTATGAAVGRQFALVLDGVVLTAPTVHAPICGGNGQITGAVDAADARTLAALLRAGPLPAPLEIVGERVADAEVR